MTLSEYASQWLRARRPIIRRSTWALYESGIRHHIAGAPIGARPIAEITRREMKGLLVGWLEAGTRDTTVRTRIRVLHCLFASAVDDEVLPTNPMHGMSSSLFGRLRDRRVEPKALTAEQLSAFFRVAWDVSALADYFFTLYQSGLRPGEGMALQWPLLDFARRRIHVIQTYSQGVLGPTKTGKHRIADMSEPLAALLARRREMLPLDAWVFPSPKDATRPWSGPAIKKHFDRIKRAADLPAHLTPHGLRHAWTTHLLEQHIPLLYVSRKLGHASVAITADLYGARADVSHPEHLASLPSVPTDPRDAMTTPTRKGILLPFRPRDRRQRA